MNADCLGTNVVRYRPLDGLALLPHPVAPVHNCILSLRAFNRLEFERSHGEPFPLPKFQVAEASSPSAPKYVQRRRRRLRPRQGIEGDVVECLNHLSASRIVHKSPLRYNVGRRTSVATQESVLLNIQRRVTDVGRMLADLAEHGALWELLSAKSNYNVESTNLASFDVKFEDCKGHCVPPVASELPTD